MSEQDANFDETLGGVVFILIVVLIVLSAVGCANTEAALAQLPEGYWMATEALLVGICLDVWEGIQLAMILLPVL